MIVGLDAGDWRRPDDEFAASFRAPPTRCDALRLRNPFPRESRIHFDEPSHIYTVDNKTVVPRSVTGFVHRYCNDFDPRLVIQQMQARPSWEWKQQEHLRPDGTVMSPEEIARKWERNGRVQRNRGTLLHFHCEAFLNGHKIEGPPSPEFCQVSVLFLYREVSLCSSGFSTPGPSLGIKNTSGCGFTKTSSPRVPPSCGPS